MHVDKLKPCHDPEEQTLDSRLPVDASEITSDDDQASDVQGIGDDTMGHVPPTFDLSWARRGGHIHKIRGDDNCYFMAIKC